MPPKFGTSGLRGLVVELTPDLVTDCVQAFVASCAIGQGVFVGRDLRPSSPDIAQVVISAVRARGVDVTDCGAVSTPALALAAMSAGAGAVMITGSHIPADRNGLKFYTPQGEITKADEAGILAELGQRRAASTAPGNLKTLDADAAYVRRAVAAFGADAFADMTLGVYSHATVGRDVLATILRTCGAQVVELGRSDIFIPVDTEAVDPAVRTQLAAWAAAQSLDAIVSMDGDADRPLLADATGQIVPGDVMGQIAARVLGADTVVTPVSANSGVEASGHFGRVVRTRIGSPFVIAGMETAGGRVVGYEPNGGFLLGFAAQGPTGEITPLMTRDAVLPLLAVLWAAREGGVAACVLAEPHRFTATDRLQNVPTETSLALVASMDANPKDRAAFVARLGGAERAIDRTDGLRIMLADGRVVHLRPSGNAPELRLYVEAETPQAAQTTLAAGLAVLADLVAR
jgi:phosphomannomutase